MSNKPELDLLMEIIKLLKRFGPETFEKLAGTVGSPEFSEDVVSILSGVAKGARTIEVVPKRQRIHTRSANKERSRKNFRSWLAQTAKVEPEKTALLLKLYEDLTDKNVLPTLREIRMLALDCGLPPLKATSRDKAIVPLVKALMILPLDKLRAKISLIKPATSQDDRGLEGWTNIILGREMRR